MSRHQKRLALEGLAWEREQMAAAASPPSPDPFDRLPPDCLLRVLIALKAQTLARFAVAVPVGFRVSQRLPDVLRGVYHDAVTDCGNSHSVLVSPVWLAAAGRIDALRCEHDLRPACPLLLSSCML